MDQYLHDDQFLAQIIDQASCGIVVVDARADLLPIIYTNALFCAMVGASHEEIIGQPIETWYVENVTGFVQSLHTGIKNGQSQSLTVVCRRANKQSFPVSVTLAPLVDPDGDISHLALYHHDTSEIKETLVALQGSEIRFRQLVEQAAEAVYIVDPSTGLITDINQAACDTTGYSRDELLILSLSDIFIGLRIDDLVARLDRLNSESVLVFNGFQMRADGSTFQDETRAGYIKIGHNDYILVLSRDITAEVGLQTAFERQTELNDLRSQFISMASHEFRTPLATIQAAVSNLQHYLERMTTEDREKRFVKVYAEVERMTQLLDELLEIGKMEAEIAPFNPAPLDFYEFCQEVVNQAEMVDKQQHPIRLDYVGDNLVVADEKLLQHIISNLLSNACKYSPSGNDIEVNVLVNKEGIHLEIQDHGIGIPNHDIKHLFEPFHRADNVGNIVGTGLGMSIVKNAVELHGGEINVTSIVGQGTTFSIYIPSADKR